MPPRNIIFYRDGVSEGEYAQVTKHEIEQIKGKRGFPWNGLEPVLTVMSFRGVPRDANTRGILATAALHRGWQAVRIRPLSCLSLAVFLKLSVTTHRHHIRFFPKE